MSECVTDWVDRGAFLYERRVSVESEIQWPGMASCEVGWFHWYGAICFCPDCSCVGSLGSSVSLERGSTLLPSRGFVVAYRVLVLGGTLPTLPQHRKILTVLTADKIPRILIPRQIRHLGPLTHHMAYLSYTRHLRAYRRFTQCHGLYLFPRMSYSYLALTS